MRRGLHSLRAAAASLAIATAMAMLAACGQKGPLYLPDEQRNAVVTPVTSSAPAATPAPATEPAAAASPPAPADPTDPESQRRSNTPPRTN